MKTLGILAFTPTNLLNAFAAIKTRHATTKYQCVVVICRFPQQRDSDAQEMSKTMRAVLRSFSHVKSVVEVADEALTADIALGHRALIQSIRQKMRWRLDEIYFAHDYVGIIYQCFCLAYPRASRIVFGDGFGYLISRPDLHQTIVQRRQEGGLFSGLRSMFGAKTSPVKLSWNWENIRRLHFMPDAIYVMMPMEMGYRQTRHAPLEVVPALTIRGILRQVSEDLGLGNRERQILTRLRNQKTVLLLTSNWSEAAMSTPEDEIDLYMAIIQPHLTSNCSVIVKTHPGSADTEWRMTEIRRRLGKDIEMISFPEDLKRYPLELFENLVRHCTIATSSSFLLSARFLYCLELSSSLTPQMIEQYLGAQYHDEMLEDLGRHESFSRALETWDGKSVILSSPEPPEQIPEATSLVTFEG